MATISNRRRTLLTTASSPDSNSNPDAQASTGPRAERLKGKNLFESLIRLRDEQREKKKSAVWLIKGKDLPLEVNRHGQMYWYMHPELDDLGLRNLLFYKQVIPAGSRSGRQQCQGGVVFFVEEGRGYTLLDGTRHAWKKGDMINLPIREEGVIYQHFNADADKPAVLLACEPNHMDALGVDKGAGFDELEAAPEYVNQAD